MKRDKEISYLKSRMDRLEETTKRIEIADYNKENARLGRIVLDDADPRFQERRHLSTTPLPTLATLYRKSEFWKTLDTWMETKLRIISHWQLLAIVVSTMFISVLVGNAIGYNSGYEAGLAVHTPTFETIAGQVDVAPMTLSQFGTWFMQLELPPMWWALIILLILMVIR